MTDAERAYRHIVRPACEAAAARHKRPALASRDAYRVLLAIAGQESKLVETIQRGADRRPLVNLARGFWQFESGGGVAGVLRHPAAAWCRTEIVEMGYPLHNETLHWALAYDQRLAAIMARALLWTDPQPLPRDEKGAWELYLRTWRPGKPHPATWPDWWRRAEAALADSEAERLVPRMPPSEPMPSPIEPPQIEPRPAPVEPGPPSNAGWVIARTPKDGAYQGRKVYWDGSIGPSGGFMPNMTLYPQAAVTFASREDAQAALLVDDRLAKQGYKVEAA